MSVEKLHSADRNERQKDEADRKRNMDINERLTKLKYKASINTQSKE